MPAGLLLGPMIAAIALAGTGRAIELPGLLANAGQAVVGLLIATSFSPALLSMIGAEPLVFAGTTAATLAMGVAVGVLLTRAQVLPGTAALWGSMPGAATAMTLMARRYDADERLVAVMTFTRVACVATLASLIAFSFGGGAAAGQGPGAGWFPALHPVPFATTIGLAALGAWAGLRFRLPAGALLGPMIAAGLLAFTGHLALELPGWLLALGYALVGWRIGLGFTAEVLRAVGRALPNILLSIGALIVSGAALGWLLTLVTGRDLLTCYLATSPGGADSVAIIASETTVDVPFVMAMQVLRFIAVLGAGPVLARFVAERL